MAVLMNTGTCAYNGVSWTSLYRSKIDLKPVKDSAGRALVAREYTLEIQGKIAEASGSTTDLTLTGMRDLLEQPAGALEFSSKGYGSLNVNVPGGKLWDAAYGPWPDVLSWDPVGNDQSCLVHWRVKTVVPCEANPSPKGIIEMCWDVSWDVDEDGYTRRTIQGHLIIEATRSEVQSRQIPDNANNYRDTVAPDLPYGFRRKQNYQLSEDKRTLHFHIEDEQIPRPYPEGASRAEAHHKTSWQVKPHSGLPVTGSLTGTITVPAMADKSIIYDIILRILQSRVLTAAKAPTLPAIPKLNRPAQPAQYHLWTLDIDDDVFGRGASFTATYLIAGALFDDFLGVSQLWQPIPQADFIRMKHSLFAGSGKGKAWAPSGIAGLGFANNQDVIVDLCSRSIEPELPSDSYNPPAAKPKARKRPTEAGPPDPARCWLRYRLKVRVRTNPRTIRHKPLSKPAPVRGPLTGFITAVPSSGPAAKPAAPRPALAPSGPTTQGQSIGSKSTTADLFQQVGCPSYLLRLEGDAIRIGYPIPTPRIASVGGIQLVQAAEYVDQEQWGVLAGVPIYAARWALDYYLPQNPNGDVPLPANPNLG